MECDQWEQVKSMNFEDLKEEVVECVGHLSAYDKLMATFWVMKGLIGCYDGERE